MLIQSTKKLAQMLYFFRKAKNVLTKRAMKFLYYSTIHCNIIYAIHVWSCTAESNLKPLLLKQKIVVRILNNSAYNAHTEPLFKACEILPLNFLCEYFKVQFMQKFTQGYLPPSFNDIWVTNAIRRADQDQVELRNADDIYIPFARLSSTVRQPLTEFPRLWASFPDEQLKFTRNVIEFNKNLKIHYLNRLSATPVCNRLLCPHCHLNANRLNDVSLDSI